jgi:tetratricopeptide (TPR) repeat protein
MSLTAFVIGLRRAAALYDERANRHARQCGDALAEAYVGWVTGIRSAGEAKWNEVMLRVESARRVAAHAGDRRLHIMTLQTLAWPPYVEGRFADAMALGREQLTIAQESNNRLWEAWGLTGMAEAAMMLGDTDAAIDFSQRSLDVLSDESEKVGEIRALGVLAAGRLRRGQRDDAFVLARRVLELISGTDLTDFSMYEGFAGACDVMLSLAEDAERRGDEIPKAIVREAYRAVAAFRQFARTFPLAGPRLHAMRARVAALDGADDVARREFDRAVAAAGDLGMLHEKGLALLASAASDAFDAPSRRQRLALALETLGPSGARRDAEQLLEELAA